MADSAYSADDVNDGGKSLGGVGKVLGLGLRVQARVQRTERQNSTPGTKTPHLLGDERPQCVHVDGGAVVGVARQMEVTHTNLAEVAGVAAQHKQQFKHKK